ncbi:MAG: hypothetical protein ACXV4A_04005, partial [Actinomycetes bacterium]
AEGVEDGATADQLALSSCDKIQGFYFSKALPATELEGWLDAREPRRPVAAEAPATKAGAAQ